MTKTDNKSQGKDDDNSTQTDNWKDYVTPTCPICGTLDCVDLSHFKL